MTPRELKRMMAAVAALSADEIETVKKALSVREGQVVKSAVEQARMASVRACPHCGSVRFVKDGHANGRQRFRCRETGCARTFNALTGTPLARLHMPEKHLENARLMAAGLSVRVTAERLGVSRTPVREAFIKLAEYRTVSRSPNPIEHPFDNVL